VKHPTIISETLEILLKTYAGKGAVELDDPFRVLFATIISQRNRDELTEIAAKNLFSTYSNIDQLAKADKETVSKLIYPTGFYQQKAQRIIKVAQIIKESFSGQVPADMDSLLTLPGVCRKTANCVLAFGYQIPAIVVDTHVFRITQRFGWLRAKTPEESEQKLEKIVPKKYWLDINRVIVQHGRAICKPIGPKCQVCPVQKYCDFGKKKMLEN
jgi:endonuclease-3